MLQRFTRPYIASLMVIAGAYLLVDRLSSLLLSSLSSLAVHLVFVAGVVALVARDHTRNNRAVRSGEDRFRTVFERAAVGIALVNRQGYPVSINPALERMLGYRQDEIGSLRIADFTHPDDVDKNIHLFEQLIRGEIDSYSMEKRYLHKDGSIVWGQLSVSIFPHDSNDEAYIISMVEDISERKRTEETLQQMNAELEKRVAERTAEIEAANARLIELDRQKSEFVAYISHELRTPLTVLNTRVYLLEHSPPERHAEYLAGLKTEIENLMALANNVLDLSRLELSRDDATFVYVDFNKAAERAFTALQPHAEAKGLSLAFDPGPGLPQVFGNSIRLTQVATNLVSNAINYTPSGGVTVSTCYDQPNHRVGLSVQDTGIGISPDEQKNLFNRFFRGDRAAALGVQGSGLGLRIVQQIVEQHGGSIEVHSEVNRGTCFQVWLPGVKNDMKPTGEN
jgi:PAS domain S-box-containing protein